MDWGRRAGQGMPRGLVGGGGGHREMNTGLPSPMPMHAFAFDESAHE